MDDLISRKAAIDTLKGLEFCHYMEFGEYIGEDTKEVRLIRAEKAQDALQNLPSAQPEPCDDAVSRADVVDMLEMYPFTEYNEYEAAREVVKRLPPVTPKQCWIPCSERLPENIRPVIVTWKNNDPASYYLYIVGKHYTGTACYKNGKWYWYSSTTEDVLAEYGRCDSEEFDEAIECIAWMPLPEPYREEGGE